VPSGRAATVKEGRLKQQGALNVKKSSLVAALAAVAAAAAWVAWMGLGGQPAEAQQAAPVRAANMPTTALIDVNYIIKNHQRLKAALDQYENDAKTAQSDWKTENDKITKEAESLKDLNLKPGSPDYAKAEEQIMNKRAQLQIRMTREKKDFVQREAKLYYAVYQEILQEVQYYCSAYNISLVLNFQGDKINQDNPQDILRGVQQQVVFYNKDLDITPWVLNRLNPRTANGSNTPSPFGRSYNK
jgi:Skp family chaperone for outer membrane proteins